MASRVMQDKVRTFGPNTKLLGFRFFPQGNSTTPMTRANGLLVGDGVASVTRQGTAGTFLVVLEDAYRSVPYINPSIQMSAATDLNPQIGDFTNEGTSLPFQFIVRALAGATPTDIAANANNSIMMQVVSKDSDA